MSILNSLFLSILGKGEVLPILSSQDTLLFIFFLPLITIIFLYVGSSLKTKLLYEISLLSSVISFLL
jgi:hypothetical protein